MKKRTIFLTLVAIFTIFAFVSCSNEVTPKVEDRLGMITFGNNGKAIGYTVKYSEEVESLYWYYTAVKLDDGYKTGQKDGYTPVVVDESSSPAQGLSGKTLNSEGFSYGYWKIELRGFSSTNVEKTDSNAAYMSTIDNFLVSSGTNSATAIIKMADGAKTTIEFGVDGIYFEEGNITAGSVFALSVTDTVNGLTVGTVDTTSTGVTSTVEAGKVTFTGLTYEPKKDANGNNVDITGTHQMEFVLTQTLSNSKATVTSYNITAAKYALNFIVNAGTTTTITGSPIKIDDTGSISINGIQDVPELVISKVLPVDSTTVDSTNKVATVSSETTINYGDFSVTYPQGAKISTASGDSGTTLSDDSKTSDTTIKFEYESNEAPSDGESGKITLINGDTSEKFDLGLTASTGTTDETKNTKLITITKNVGTGKKFTSVYHNNESLNALEAIPALQSSQTLDDVVTTESYYYNSNTGTLTLYLYHASPIYLITQNPVASVGNNQYYTLSDAINVVDNEGTVKILNNINLNETISVAKSFTLDMGDKVITLVTADDKTGSITVGEGGVISVVNKNSKQENVITGVEKKSSNGDCTYYSTFEKALAKVSNGDTITLNKEDKLDTNATPSKSFTINLNSKTLTVNNSAKIIVESGTITVAGAADGQNAFIQGVNSATGIDGTYYPRVVSVTSGYTTTYYATIEDAMDDAESGATVKLLQNVTITKPITVASTIVLDLDGKTITSSGDNLIYVSSGTLTVSNAASGQTEFVQGAKGSSTDINGEYSPRVARVGNYYYATIEEAVEKASSDDTISLLSSVTLTETLTLDKNLTLDLNNKALDLKTNSINLNEDTDSKVTLRNGTIKSSGRNETAFYISYGNKLTLDSITLNDTDSAFYWGTFIVVEVLLDSKAANKSPELVISNSTLTSDSKFGMIEVDGDTETYNNTSNIAKITISNSVLVCSGISTVSISGSSEGTIENSTIEGPGQTVLSITGGTHAIKNSEIIFSDGSSSYGQALEVGGNNGGGCYCAATVTLDNVTLTVNDKDAIALTVNGTAGGKTPKLTGTFSSNVGSYSVNETADVYLAKGGIAYVSGAENLKNAVGGGGGVTLLSDVTLSEDLAFDKDITFDFNGNVITGCITVETANITFDDSGENGGVESSGTNGVYAIKVAQDNANIVINGGTYRAKASGNSTYLIDACNMDNFVLTIQGGTFYAEANGYAYIVRAGYYSEYVKDWNKSATITVNSGNFETKDPTATADTTHRACFANGYSELTINDCTYKSDCSFVFESGAKLITINGGAFNLGENNIWGSPNTYVGGFLKYSKDDSTSYSSDTFKLNGGKINKSTPEAILTANNCSEVQSEDGYYTITKNADV